MYCRPSESPVKVLESVEDIANSSPPVSAQCWRKEAFGNVDGVASEFAEVVVHVHFTAHSGMTRGGSLCIFVNNSWCMKSKEVSRFCSPEVEYLMIKCRPHYSPREFSAKLFMAVNLPPQTDAGTKTVLSQL